MGTKVALSWVALATLSTFGCTRGARSPESEPVSLDGGVIGIDAAVSTDTDAATASDAAIPALPLEERFAGACMRWHTWSTPEADACEMCRAASCFEWAFRAESTHDMCPGEYECVQDTCYPTGLASSIECGCVLTCMTTQVCRETWLAAMECVAEHCGDACGEIPPD